MTFIAKIFWNENDRRLRTLWRLVLQIVLLFLVLLVLKYVILLATALVGLATQSITPGQMNYDSITALFLAFSENHYDVPLLAQEFISILVSVWLAGRLLDRRRFASFGLRLNKNWWIDFGFGLFLGGFLISLVFLIQLASGWITVTGVFITDNSVSPFAIAILYPAVTMLLVGIQEELIFRGYQLTNLAEGLNGKRIGSRGAVISAALLSAVTFALLHANNPHASAISAFSAFMGGIIAALGFILTGELAIPIGLHITWNFFQANVFGFTLSGMEFSWATILATEQSGPALWVGDAFGPESGLLAIGAVALGCALIMLWVRLRYGRVGLHTSIVEASREESFTMKKSHSLFMFALIIILSILWLGSSSCATPQPAATELPQVEEQTTNTPLQPTATPIPPTASPEPESGTISLQSPLGNAAAIDGAFSPGEWDGALTTNLTNGGELMLMHNDGYLYLGIRSRAMGFGTICTVEDNQVSILHSSAGLGTALFEEDGADWRRTQQFSYCCWEATQTRLNTFLAEEEWVASIAPKGVPEEMEYQIAMNGGSLTLAVVYVDDFSFETALYWPENLDDECLGLALIPGDPPERLSFSPATWVTITTATDPSSSLPTPAVAETLIAFTSARDGDYDIYIINVDGSDLRQLTNDPGTEDYTALSPDDAKIAFYTYDDLTIWSIYVMNTDGTERQRLTSREGVWDSAPTWSPDGTRIAIGREVGDKVEIWVMNADGSDQKKLKGVSGGGPRWSPDGRQIGFSSASTGDSEIAVMDADGGNQRPLTDNDAEDWWPSWSPDGSQIAFMSGSHSNFEIYVMNADGSDIRQLTNNQVENYRPSWPPDGAKIIFTSNHDGDFEIMVMNADGSNQQQITNNSEPDIQPAWWHLTQAAE